MQVVSSLDRMKTWLEGQINAEKLVLKSPVQENRADAYALVTPAVHIGYVPPNGILDQNAKIRIPCLVVGAPEADDDRENTTFTVQVTAAVYDPGNQTFESDSQKIQLVPNFDGYITLLNFLDRVKEWVLRSDGIADRFQLESAVKLKTYEEQPWPYWYGSLIFMVSGIAAPVTRYADTLQ